MLTIIMPAYNAGPFIKEAVDSLLQQSFSDFELWIVNDASTDSTQQVITTYTDIRIKIFNNPANTGRDGIVNAFVPKVQTPFFTVTDADDVSHPLRLQRQIEKLQSDKALMMCGTSYTAIDAKGYRLHTNVLLADHKSIIANLHKHSQFLGGTVVFRTEVIELFTPFYREVVFEAFADADLCCRIAEQYAAANLLEPLFYYRIVESSMSRKVITATQLNMYKFIYLLHKQRTELGQDAIQTNDTKTIEGYTSSISAGYSPDSLQRHIAFYHLYWGLPALAVTSSAKSIFSNPFYLKNFLSFFYIIFRSGLFYLNRVINKVHYTTLIRRTT